MKTLILATIFLFLTGCSNTSSLYNTEHVRSTKPQTERNYYSKGYEHGCSSKTGEYKKNIRRYVKNETYRNGWNEGNFHCGEKLGKKYPFDEDAYKDGYLSAMYGKAIIKYRNESYRQSWKVGYNYYKKHPKKLRYQ